MLIETTAFMSDAQSKTTTGRQRHVRHKSTPDNGSSITWDHAETFAPTCDACCEIAKSIGWEKYHEQLAKDAPGP